MTRRRKSLFRPAIFLLIAGLGGATLSLLSACGSDDGSSVTGRDGNGDGTGGTGASGINVGGNAGSGANLNVGGNAGGGVVVSNEPQGPRFVTPCNSVPAYTQDQVAIDACGAFSSATPASTAEKPSFMYPLANTLMPPNLPKINIHWQRPEGLQLSNYRLEVSGDDGSKYWFFLTCPQEYCDAELPSNEWRWLGWKFAGSTATLTISGLQADGTLVSSDPLPVSFTRDDIRGALYYWAASRKGPGTPGAEGVIMRTSAGADAAAPFIEPSPYRKEDGAFYNDWKTASPTNDFNCSACHSVSRDGSTIAFAVLGLRLGEGEENNNVSAIQIAPTTDPENPYVSPPGAVQRTPRRTTRTWSVSSPRKRIDWA